MASTSEVFESTTEAIIRAIEAGVGTWEMPWTSGAVMFPVNPVTGARYRGGNVLTLWGAAIDRGFAFGQWATFKQWASIDARVRRGERGTAGVFFTTRTSDASAGDEVTRLVARRFVVFNAAQVDGFSHAQQVLDPAERIATRGRAFAAVGARVEHRSEGRAYYRPSQDLIVLPPFETFTDPVGYYGTTAHEHAHWTGHRTRLGRDLTGRFGEHAYAVEELIAELSAAFTCAALGIEGTPRPDHAAYLAHWIQVLKSDTKALHHIAGRAQAATDFLVGLGAA